MQSCLWCGLPIPKKQTESSKGGHSHRCRLEIKRQKAEAEANAAEEREHKRRRQGSGEYGVRVGVGCDEGLAQVQAAATEAPASPTAYGAGLGGGDELQLPSSQSPPRVRGEWWQDSQVHPTVGDGLMLGPPSSPDAVPVDAPGGSGVSGTNPGADSSCLPTTLSRDGAMAATNMHCPAGGPLEAINIAGVLRADSVLALMLHGLTNAQKTRILTGSRILNAMAHAQGASLSNPLLTSSIRTPAGYDVYMDKQAAEYHCSFRRHEVPIESESEVLRGLPPLPLYMRDLADVILCALAVVNASPATVVLAPFPPSDPPPGRSPSEGRVEHPMQGSYAHAAHQVCSSFCKGLHNDRVPCYTCISLAVMTCYLADVSAAAGADRRSH